jgi:diadenylate cyclase
MLRQDNYKMQRVYQADVACGTVLQKRVYPRLSECYPICNGKDVFGHLLEQLKFFTWQDAILAIIDIALVAYFFYKIYTLIKGTRAVQLLKGIIILLLLVSLTQWARLYTVNWLLVQIRTMLLVALPVVFQPELRRALEQIGRGKIFSRSFLKPGGESIARAIDEIVSACFDMSSDRIGALIVLERQTGLEEYMEDAVRLDALVSRELLKNIFNPGSPLHDGACIIRGDRIAAAASFLPFTQDPVAIELGSRHRAAIGVTQVSDAVSVVVSEETGIVSFAEGGRLIRGLDAKTLKEKLMESLDMQPISGIFGRGYDK